eukprot:scaffold447688_cov34-Prasinocladus_malaysianus.AAC.1
MPVIFAMETANNECGSASRSILSRSAYVLIQEPNVLDFCWTEGHHRKVGGAEARDACIRITRMSIRSSAQDLHAANRLDARYVPSTSLSAECPSTAHKHAGRPTGGVTNLG